MSMNKLTSYLLLILLISGVLCQPFSSSPDEICPGDNVTFTCVVEDSIGNSLTTWEVTPDGSIPPCRVVHRDPIGETDACGPGGIFTSSLTNRPGDSYTSTLRVESISDDLNDTRVECQDILLVDVGMRNICIIDDVSLDSQSISASVSVPDLCNNTACMVNVRWSEPFVSCGGSVSHYALSVTPPTSDCQSGSGDSGSEFIMTTETQYDLTVTAEQTYILNISVNNSCGDIGQATEYIIDAGVATTCNYSYIYNVTSLEIEEIFVTWDMVDVLNAEADYRVVIIPGSEEGSGNEIVFNDSLTFNCIGDSCSYTFSSDGITDSYSVAVEVVGCVITRTECTNTSSVCNPGDLLVELPSYSGTWSNPTFGETGYSFFDGGNVTFDGIIEGSTATYTTINTTHGDYFVSGEQSFDNTTCLNGSWIPLPNVTAKCNISSLFLPRKGNCPNGLRFEFNSRRVDDIATYSTTSDCCIISTSGLTRECQEDRSWSGSVPRTIQACNDAKLLLVHIILIVIGVIVYISGMCVAVYFVLALFKKASSCIGFIRIWYRTLIVVSVVISIMSLIVWLIMIVYISNNDFCDKDGGYIRRPNSVCKHPSGKNATRNGLVVGSLLSSVLVLVVWITLAILKHWGFVSEFNKPPRKPQRSTNRGMSWEGEEKQELKEVVSEPTTPPLHKDDDKPNPDDDSYDTVGVSSSKSPISSGPDDSKPKEAVPKSGSKPKKSGSKSKKSAPKPKEPDPDGEDAQYDVVVKPSHPEPETEEAKEKLKEKRADGVHYGKLDHGVTVRPHAASMSSAPPVPSPTDHEEYSRLRGHQPGQTYGKISRVADSGPEYGKLDTSQVAKPGATGDMYDVVHSDQPRHIPRPREEQAQPIPGVPGDLYTEVRNEPLHVPPGQHKGPYESDH